MNTMQRSTTCILIVAIAGALAACGGGSGAAPPSMELEPLPPEPEPTLPEPSQSSFEAATAISRTKAIEPVETVADQEERSEGILQGTVELMASTVYGERSGTSFRLSSACSGTSCTFTNPSIGVQLTLYLENLLNFEASYDQERAVLTRNGITLLEGRGGDRGPTYRTYGAWMENGGFTVEAGVRIESEEQAITLRGGAAAGALTGFRPPASATWLGVMVGTPAEGSGRDNILQGDASLTYSLGSRTLDVDFTDIQDLDRGTAHTVQEVSFRDLSVSADGSFGTGGVGDRIRGGFTGPGHEEVLGVFEKQGIVGTFGATQ